MMATVVYAIVSAPKAQTVAPVQVVPSPQIAVLSPLPPSASIFGAWACTGSFRTGKLHRASFQVETALSGKWIRLKEQDIEPATGYVAEYLIGYDPAKKRLIEFDANNFGASTFSSVTGWSAGVLTMTSETDAAGSSAFVANQFVYTVAANREFTVDWQIRRTATANWQTADHLVCLPQEDRAYDPPRKLNSDEFLR